MKLTKKQWPKREGDITEEELLQALKKISKYKLPENDRITKEFYVPFWDDLKTLLLLSANKAFKVGELRSTSQKVAVIKLFEKKDNDKQLIKNWRPIFYLKSWVQKF